MKTTIIALGAAAALTFAGALLPASQTSAAENPPAPTMPMMPMPAPGGMGGMGMPGMGTPGMGMMMPMMNMMPMMMGMMPSMPGMNGTPGMTGMGLPTGDDGPASLAFSGANNKMHRDMAITYTGKADVDFVKGMIPHHQGAIDMAKIELAFGSDPETKKLAEDIIKAQEAEIAMMRDWLKKNGE